MIFAVDCLGFEQPCFLGTEYGRLSHRAKNLQRGTYGSVHGKTAGRHSVHTTRDALGWQSCDRRVVVKRMCEFMTLHPLGLGTGLTERAIEVHTERRGSYYLKVVGKGGRWTVQGPRLCLELRYPVIPAEYPLSDAGRSVGLCYGLQCGQLEPVAGRHSRLGRCMALLAGGTVRHGGRTA